MSTPAPSTDLPPSWRALAVRWAVVALIGIGGAWGVQRIVTRMQARAAVRLATTDWSRFQGCLLGVPIPSDAATPDRMLALARGTGDPVWPHTCAAALTRLEHTTEEIASDDARARPLADAAREMQNGLAEAVFWTEHVRAGHIEPPAWVAQYLTLEHAMAQFLQARGVAALPPEPTRHPRVPHVQTEPDPPPTPVSLRGGTSADLVDATATPTEFALVMRDDHARHAVCRWPLSPGDAPIRCAQFVLPRIADPRYAGFVPSFRDAHLAVWGRAPYSLRGLVDVGTQHIELIAGGNPDAVRDYWVGPEHSFAIQITGHGPSVLVGDGHGSRDVPLPGSLDVLTTERALLGTAHGAMVAWLDARTRSHASLLTVALGGAADPPSAPRTVASWHEPRLTGIDRRVVPCSVVGGASYLLVGDGRGAALYRTDDGATLQRGPDVPLGMDRDVRLVCDAHGATTTWTAEGVLHALRCDGPTCTVAPPIPFEGALALARIAGDLLVADGTGEAHALRLRRLDAAGVLTTVPLPEPVPSAREVRLAVREPTVALFAAADETYALRSSDAGHTFVPAVVAP